MIHAAIDRIQTATDTRLTMPPPLFRTVTPRQRELNVADVERMEFQLALRRRGISSQAVLRAMDEVPREYFVENQFREAAYADRALPIACGQTISQPYVVAYMSEQLGVRGHHRVLEIGTGSGYQAAVLSRLAQEVVTIERFRTLAEAARARIETLGYRNVEVRLGDGYEGAPDRAPFDRIVVTAACEAVPEALTRQRHPVSARTVRVMMPIGMTDVVTAGRIR